MSGENDKYAVVASNKQHEIWQRDSLSIEIYSREVAMQKLSYIHFNPVNGKWKLAKYDLDYYYSSARFYENGIDEFKFLKKIFMYLMGNKVVVACATHQGGDINANFLPFFLLVHLQVLV